MNQSQNNTPSLVSPYLAPADLKLEKPLRLGVMASGSGTNMEALAIAIEQGLLKAEIKVLVYNNPGAKVVARAEKWGIPTVLLDHRQIKGREALDRAIVEVLQKEGVDWVIMAGWMRIVTPVLLNAYPDRVINIHPSLLPSFKGIHAIEQALAAGVKVTGCTVHIAREEVDSGPILMQAVVPVLDGDTPETLHARVQVQEHIILPRAIALASLKFSN